MEEVGFFFKENVGNVSSVFKLSTYIEALSNTDV
jgi:hypothetical protein